MRLPRTVLETRDFLVAWKGCVPIERVVFSFDPMNRLRLTPEERREIDLFWQDLQGQGRHLHDSPLYRLTSFEEQDEDLVLGLGLTGYKEYQGTNVRQPQWALDATESKMANALALCAIAVTCDGRAFLQARSQHVGEYPGFWHVTPSGHLHPPQSLTDALMAELKEELDISPDEVVNPVLVTGLVMNKAVSKPELTLLLRLNADSQEVLNRTPQDGWEFHRLEPLEWKADVVAGWLRENHRRCVPNGVVALLLGGRIEFGESWMGNALETLR
jgi:hypothetical protein